MSSNVVQFVLLRFVLLVARSTANAVHCLSSHQISDFSDSALLQGGGSSYEISLTGGSVLNYVSFHRWCMGKWSQLILPMSYVMQMRCRMHKNKCKLVLTSQRTVSSLMQRIRNRGMSLIKSKCRSRRLRRYKPLTMSCSCPCFPCVGYLRDAWLAMIICLMAWRIPCLRH